MSVELPILPTLRDAHGEAEEEFWRWRGLCVDHYALIETSLAKGMAAIFAHTKGSKAKRHTMFGASVLAIKKALETDGPLASAGAEALTALQEADKALSDRNMMIHATGRVLIDAHGAWVWLYRYQPTGVNKALLEGFITQNNANRREKELRRSRDELEKKIKQFSDRLAKMECVQVSASLEPVATP